MIIALVESTIPDVRSTVMPVLFIVFGMLIHSCGHLSCTPFMVGKQLSAHLPSFYVGMSLQSRATTDFLVTKGSTECSDPLAPIRFVTRNLAQHSKQRPIVFIDRLLEMSDFQ